MDKNNLGIFKKWWVRTIRERNYFGFRYWWFNWLLLISAILLFIWGMKKTPAESNSSCNYNFSNKMDSIYVDLSRCCECHSDSIPERIMPPPDTIPPIDSVPPPPPPPPPKKPPVNSKKCNTAVKSGGGLFTEDNIVLGTKSGMVSINYDMDSYPDKMEVFYEGRRIASTFVVPGNDFGFVGRDNQGGEIGVLTFNYKYHIDQHVTVRVTGRDTGTSWNYTIGCPK
jgi:hypothetical protein